MRWDTCPSCGGAKTAISELCQSCRFGVIREGNAHDASCPSCGKPKDPRAKLCSNCFAANLSVNNDDRPFPIGGNEAARYGATTTLENEDGERLVLHRTGPVTRAVREAYAAAVSLDPTFLVVCVSTPSSIHTDLQGHRRSRDHRFGGVAAPPELSQGFADIIHPRVLRR